MYVYTSMAYETTHNYVEGILVLVSIHIMMQCAEAKYLLRAYKNKP